MDLYEQVGEVEREENSRDFDSLASECDVLDKSLTGLTKVMDYTIIAGMIGINVGLVT